MAATTHDILADLRGATYRGDGETVVSCLDRNPWSELLQHAGDGLLVALDRDVAGAPELAARCSRELRERGWTGDDELADQLEGRLGTGPTPLLRRLPVELDELNHVLEGDPRQGGGRVDLRTGEVWPDDAFDPMIVGDVGLGDEDVDDRERWLPVDSLGSRDGYRDMEWFTGRVTDPQLADRLRIALDGRGAFRRFRGVLDRSPATLAAWRAFSDERSRGRARAWLADAGYTPTPR